MRGGGGRESSDDSDAEGEGGGDEGDADGGAGLRGERGREFDRVKGGGDDVFLEGGFAQVAVVG